MKAPRVVTEHAVLHGLPGLKTKLAAVGEEYSFWADPSSDVHGKVLGVALILPSIKHPSITTYLSEEQRLLFDMHGRDRNVIFFSVSRAVCFQQPEEVTFVGRAAGPSSIVFSMHSASVQRLLTTARTQSGDLLQHLLMQWQMDNSNLLDLNVCNTVLQVWPPIACLLVRGSWNAIAHSPRCRIDPRCHLRELFFQPGIAPMLNSLDLNSHVETTPEIYSLFADDLRRWVLMFRRHDDLSADEEVRLEMSVIFCKTKLIEWSARHIKRQSPMQLAAAAVDFR